MARRRKANAPPLTQERLHQVLLYDPGTGLFWRFKKKTAGFDMSKPAGSYDDMGYVQILVDSVRYRAHQLAWFYTYGVWPTDKIDHEDGVESNNRIDNLREATNTENCRNSRTPSHNTSGFKGATRWRKGWAARIKFNKKTIHLGCFATVEEAHAAYCAAARRLHGKFWNPGG